MKFICPKMKRFAKIALVMALMAVITVTFTGCEFDYEASGSAVDAVNTTKVADTLATNQKTPTDINYSLERYNLIRRAYWVNGQREKANTLVCAVEKPLGYIVLFAGNTVVGRFVVDGKVSSLNSYLTPDSEYYELYGGTGYYTNKWLADVDGTYGENDNGIFFFTTDGKYIEWTGEYLYSDIPFVIENPIVRYTGGNE